ncbi:alpha/beta hydrolase [Sphingomonas adhaesiva]|uniref:alpha/beta hydrolase n=1 Tax=Sphingomonas adhaesiva TaxID=28212 RepID=UPI000830E991|nr:alpha/beta hydrolase-fold protein [Sphingomonas adhaesiva]
MAWLDGTLPPAIVACASVPTRNGFYIDQPGGPAWERLVAIELPEFIATLLPLNGIRVVLGFSMGGYGALKLAFRQLDRFRAVAASCPAIFPAERSMAVPEHNRPGILDELNRSMGETPERYAENCVPALLRSRRDAIRLSGLSIRLECGDRDEFRLHDGAMYLHDLMGELDVPHHWRLIPGIGHGDDADGRLASALVFLGNAIR